MDTSSSESEHIDGMTGATPPLTADESQKLDSMLDDFLGSLDKPVTRSVEDTPKSD